ncbi:MAG TPA: hypothetical protein PK469_02990 [bacterium]|nr:hypothetical protein [bacterium]
MTENKLLITQSFIVDSPGSYWDYRDYIFSFCSNLCIKDQIFRLNIERDGKWLPEFSKAAEHNNFKNFAITNFIPESWADYMIREIEKNKTDWVMPFPGDHIYINEDYNLLAKLIEKAEFTGADALSYGHIQDWDYLLDWSLIKKIYEDDDCVVIHWGHKYKFCRNRKLVKDALKKINKFIVITPVPGYLIYRSDFLIKILKAIPFKTKRWQDMEYSPAKEAYDFKILLPKKCLYRHVHGYWLEIYLKNKKDGLKENQLDNALKSIYIPTNYDWQQNSAQQIINYKEKTLFDNPYFNKYFVDSNKKDSNLFSVKNRNNRYKLVIKLEKIFRSFIFIYFFNWLLKIKKSLNNIIKFKK